MQQVDHLLYLLLG
ncbi:hypothetical protein SS209_03639 [Salmonella enterica subsp. enterica serovar Senftenberg str. SS209]|nr:hypothetical protein SS209_03639 [Salmonella enterica subsp. enterica serovar Senftenberg str. SS209]